MFRIPGWTKFSSLLLRLALLAGVAVSAQLAGPAWAGVIYVKDDAAGANDGHSWSDAYTGPRAALAAAVSGDEIWVAKGTYKPTSGTLRTASFELKQGVGLYGGFAGAETERDQRNWRTNPTILSGDIGEAGNINDNTYRVVIGARFAVLDGFTVTGGSYIAGNGSGMFNSNCSPTVTNCTFTGNIASSGAAMVNDNGASPDVTSCTFTGNTATFNGAGMYNSSGVSPVVANCVFTSNTITSNRASDGGAGMYNDGSTVKPTVVNCTFSGNTAASANGGGMYNKSSSPTVANCVFWNNTASSGAEIYNASAAAPTLSHCDIQGSGGSGASWDTALGADGGGNIAADPRFVAPANPAGLDGIWQTRDDGLRIRPDSPCVGAADSAVAPKTDITGRPRKSYPDMGAYEAPPASAGPAWQLFR